MMETTTQDPALIRLDDDGLPFSRDQYNHYWGYRVEVGLDAPFTQRDVWVRNPEFGIGDDGEGNDYAYASYADLRDDQGKIIDIDDAEDEGWIDDIAQAVLEDLHASWEPS